MLKKKFCCLKHCHENPLLTGVYPPVVSFLLELENFGICWCLSFHAAISKPKNIVYVLLSYNQPGGVLVFLPKKSSHLPENETQTYLGEYSLRTFSRIAVGKSSLPVDSQWLHLLIQVYSFCYVCAMRSQYDSSSFPRLSEAGSYWSYYMTPSTMLLLPAWITSNSGYSYG